MADPKKPSIKFISPRGVTIFPKLNEPDFKFNANGEYRCKLRLNPEDISEELTAQLTKLRDDLATEKKAELTKKKEGAKAKSMTVLEVFKDETDKESGEATGKVLMSTKMVASGISKRDGKPWKREPKLFDAAGKKLNPSKKIWGGSEVKCAVEAMAYYMPKDNEVGVAFYLEAVQVLKLVVANGKDAAGYGFGTEEGYTGDDEEGDAPFPAEDGDAPADGAPAKAGDDF
jgi:hypothetical protein